MNRRDFMKLSTGLVTLTAIPKISLGAAKALDLPYDIVEIPIVTVPADPSVSLKIPHWYIREWTLRGNQDITIDRTINGFEFERPGIIRTCMDWVQEILGEGGMEGLPMIEENVTLQDFAKHGVKFPIDVEFLPKNKFRIINMQTELKGNEIPLIRYSAMELL